MGFPETRDLGKDVLAGKVAVRRQNRYSKVVVLTPEPVIYRDTNPLPSPELLAALTPSPQILMYGDGLPYPGFLRSFSVADMPYFEWFKLIGLVTFLLLPNFAPFQDDSSFFPSPLNSQKYSGKSPHRQKDAKTNHHMARVRIACGCIGC